jgi:class 3 adenylate cyclase
VISIRESFSAKLLSAFLGTIGLLTLVTLAVVQTVTGQQVELVAARTVQNAGTLIEASLESQRVAMAGFARPFTQGNRAVQALRSALENDDLELIVGNIAYEMDLQDQTQALVAVAGDDGVLALTMIGGEVVFEGDPAGIQSLAEEVLFGDSLATRGYRVVRGTMYDIRAEYIEFRRQPVGAVIFGLPIENTDLGRMGRAGGFEACLAYGGACMHQTPGIDSELQASMLVTTALTEPLRLEAGGSEWSISAEPLIPGRPADGHRIIAVPLDAVLAPFSSILRALLLGGLGALALSLFLGTALSRSLTRPVKALVAATGRVAEGDYHTEVSIDSKDEIGKLASAFNEMTRGLLVREQYRSVLSKVVSKDIAEELMKGDVELGGENREMTVLFADIRGFTPLTEGMEPQSVIALLNECMEHLANAVDAEGGVVDKFIGDEVMAVFGAPVAQPDHALRAVSAALRMRDGVEALNRDRASRGEGPVDIGIGIATGEAVAGNMGSSDRMNYTVLGATVNLAARLTSEATGGEILISPATHRAAGPACVTVAGGSRDLKGFTDAVEVFSVASIDRAATRSAPTAVLKALPTASTLALLAGAGLAALTASGLTPATVDAQWPTLADAGIGYLSESGMFQMDLSGQLDLELLYFQNEEPGLSGLAFGSGALFAPRLRLFLDTFYGDHVYALVEFRGDRGEAPTADVWEGRIEQAYVRLATGGGTAAFQGGIFVSPFGSYATRHLSVVDPFIRPPLMYDYRTVISRRAAAPNEEQFAQWKYNPEAWRTDGAPPVWAVPYQWGGMVTLAKGFLTGRVAAMNSAPSSEPDDWYAFEVVEKPSFVGGLRAKVSPEVSLGVSYNKGPYVRTDAVRPPSQSMYSTTYNQEMWSIDADFARGPIMLRGEFVHDAWDVPNVEPTAVDLGFNFEAQVDVATGWSVAARYGRIDFNEISTFGDWDWDVTRWEGSIGYRITLNAGIMASYAMTSDVGPVDPRDNLTAIRLWWGF